MSDDFDRRVIKFEVKNTDELCDHIAKVKKELVSLREELAIWFDSIEVVGSD